MMNNQLLAEVNILDLYPNAKKLPTVSSFASYLVNFIALGTGVVVSMIIVYEAYVYFSANGDPKKVSQAGSALFYGILGLVILMVAYWATQILARMIGKTF
jgi:Co/Zn/Cd efflux system component